MRLPSLKHLFSLLLFGALCLSLPVLPQEPERPVIDEVVISGNRHVGTALIRKQLRTREGGEFSRIDVNKDIKRLYQMNSFSRIDVDIIEDGDQFKVVFIITEKPFIRSIAFEGNRKYKDKKLQSEIVLAEGMLLNEKILSNDVVKLEDFYEKKGYKQAEIDADTVRDEAANQVDVVFRIEEGKKIRIHEINVIGAYRIKEKKLLKIMKTKKKGFFNRGVFEKTRFSEDLERIKMYYYQQGFIDIKILDVRERYIRNNRRVIIDIEISEGELYTVGDIRIEGNQAFSDEELQKGFSLRSGETFLPEKLSSDMKILRDRYLRNGYIDAEIDVRRYTADDPYLLHVQYEIKENNVAFIDKIRIIGNDKTKDVVIRRELNLKPGEKYDGVKMDVARQRLSNLGLFKTVDLYPDPTTASANRDLFVEVEEDRTGELSFGAGYSSVDKLIGFLEISQGNFDLFNFPTFTGDAQKLKFRTEFGSRKEEFLIDFSEPWMFEKKLLFGFKVYSRSREYETSDYSEDRDGFSVRFAKPVFKYSRAELRYLFENVQVENVDDDASEFLRAQEGERDVGKIGFRITRDVRDSFFSATRGSRLSLDLEMAGVGGDIEYYRGLVSTDFYFNPWLSHVFILSLRVGGVEEYGDSEEVPIFDRFFLGGAWSIRGFDYRDIGPHDELEEPLGGKFMYYGTLEYVIPILPEFRFATFFDYGNLYSDFDNVDFDVVNASVGIGMRILINRAIPLRFDYAWPVVTDDFHEEEDGKFTFDIGQRF
jgi:outer membrane protein insertion porin family